MRRLGLFLALLMLTGCETTKNRCYTRIELADGSVYKQYGMSRGTVIGGGETSSEIVGVCGTLDRNTKDTGITEEGRKTIENAVKAGVCAATGGLGCLMGN